MTKSKQFELELSLAQLQKSYNLLSKENDILKDSRNDATLKYSQALTVNKQLVDTIASLKKELDIAEGTLSLLESNLGS